MVILWYFDIYHGTKNNRPTMVFTYGTSKNTMVCPKTILVLLPYLYTMVFTQYSKVIQHIPWDCQTVVCQMVILRFYTFKNTMVHVQKTFCHYDPEWLPHLYTNVFTWYSKVIQCIREQCPSKCPKSTMVPWKRYCDSTMVSNSNTMVL